MILNHFVSIVITLCLSDVFFKKGCISLCDLNIDFFKKKKEVAHNRRFH